MNRCTVTVDHRVLNDAGLLIEVSGTISAAWTKGDHYTFSIVRDDDDPNEFDVDVMPSAHSWYELERTLLDHIVTRNLHWQSEFTMEVPERGAMQTLVANEPQIQLLAQRIGMLNMLLASGYPGGMFRRVLLNLRGSIDSVLALPFRDDDIIRASPGDAVADAMGPAIDIPDSPEGLS